MGIEKANNCETVEDVYARLKELEEETRLISSSEDLYELEQEIISYTNRLASLLLKKSPVDPKFPLSNCLRKKS